MVHVRASLACVWVAAVASASGDELHLVGRLCAAAQRRPCVAESSMGHQWSS